MPLSRSVMSRLSFEVMLACCTEIAVKSSHFFDVPEGAVGAVTTLLRIHAYVDAVTMCTVEMQAPDT